MRAWYQLRRSQNNVVLLIIYDVLVVTYYEINTLKCVLNIASGYSVILSPIIGGKYSINKIQS